MPFSWFPVLKTTLLLNCHPPTHPAIHPSILPTTVRLSFPNYSYMLALCLRTFSDYLPLTSRFSNGLILLCLKILLPTIPNANFCSTQIVTLLFSEPTVFIPTSAVLLMPMVLKRFGLILRSEKQLRANGIESSIWYIQNCHNQLCTNTQLSGASFLNICIVIIIIFH